MATRTRTAKTTAPRKTAATKITGSNLVLHESSTIFEAEEYKSSLLSQSGDGAFAVDASSVEQVDLSILQLLLAAKQDARGLSLSGQSDALKSACNLAAVSL